MSIRRLDDLEMGDLTVLIGQNGAGKSNFVAFFDFLRELVEGRLQVWVSKRGGSDRILSYGIKETKKIRACVAFGANEYEFLLVPTADERLVFQQEVLWYDKKPFYLPVRDYESQLKADAGSRSRLRADYIYEAISDWRVYHFHDTSDSAFVKRNGALHDNRYLRRDASNLAAFLFQLRKRHPDTYSQIRKTVQLAIPFFDDFALRPKEVGPEDYQIRLDWQQKGSDYEFLPSQLSDGSLRFICLVTALMQPDPPTTIIIDEPELGLHPHAIVLLGALIRSASKRMQVIVSTQSMALVDEFDLENLLIVERKDSETVFCKLDPDDYELWLEEFSVGELWKKNVLGGRIPA